MIFTETEFEHLFVIESEKIEDERGFFARTWDTKEFERRGLNPNVVQCNISFNRKRGTIRGLHYQSAPFEEAKLVRCTMGSVFEVAIDLRPKSKMFKKWKSFELSNKDHKMLYIPEGFALGFQTLEDDTELFYQMSQEYKPEYSRGILWNDITFQISWPLKPTIISKKDQSYEPFR